MIQTTKGAIDSLRSSGVNVIQDNQFRWNAFDQSFNILFENENALIEFANQQKVIL